MTIIERNLTFGNWQIRCSLDETESIFLNFDHNPTDGEVQIEVDRFIANRITEAANAPT